MINVSTVVNKFNTKSKIAFVLSTLLILAACSGGDSNSETAQPQPPVPAPLLPILNSLVDCGTYRVEPPVTLPWKLSRPSDWVIMGSSSAFGAGATSPANSWVGLLNQQYKDAGVTIHNIARGGYTTYHALAQRCVVSTNRPKADVNHNLDKAIDLKPDVVFLSYPSNDAVSGFSVSETASNLLLIRGRLMEQGAAVVVLSGQPRNTNAAAQAAILELDRVLRPYIGACFVDVHPVLVSPTGGLASQFDSGDGVHVNDAGHKLIAEEVIKTLKNGRCLEY